MSVRAAIGSEGRSVRLDWPDGRSQELAARWLFDHAEQARDPVSGQRLLGAEALERTGAIAEIRLEEEGLRLRFEGSHDWRSLRIDRLDAGGGASAPVLWPDPAPIAAAEPVAFDAYLTDDAALRETLSRVSQYGLALLTGAGAQPGEVERAVARFGFVRETNYGRIFDVRIEPSPGNLAFSGRGLELHTDNPYRDPVPTLQLLHAIIADPGGGETLFVDGFACAERFRSEAPEAFEILAHTAVRFRYTDKTGACWSASAPIIELDLGGRIAAIRLNHRALDIPPGAAAAVERWYEAYLAFHRLAHAPAAAFERSLRPGEMVIFDNRRILHGRRGLTGGSPRWLQGGYADRDGLEAALARLNLSHPGGPDGRKFRR